MNAIELADELEAMFGHTDIDDRVAALLRRQHNELTPMREAIVKLREALEGSVAYAELLEKMTYRLPDASQIKSKQALKDTEDLK